MIYPALLKYQISNIKYQIFFFILFSIFYFLYSIPASAQSQTPQVNNTQPINQVNPYLNPNTNPDVPKNQHTWVQTVMIDVMAAMSCQLTGIDPADPKAKCLGVDSETGNIGFVEGGGGAIGVAGKMIAMLYTPPLHTGDYFKYLANNFGIAKPAHAQATGGGFQGLQPIQSLWVAFRDIVYLLFVIIFIVIGLAIMLRIRIDPRTVMTIQNQIPRIIIGLLLLTFSFAIAGFLIDMMYVVIFLSYELIAGTNIISASALNNLNPLNLQGEAAIGGAGFNIFDIAHRVAFELDDFIRNLIGLGSTPLHGFNDVWKALTTLSWNPLSMSIIDFAVDLISLVFAANISSSLSNIAGSWGAFGFTLDLGAIAASISFPIIFTTVDLLIRNVLPYLLIFLVVIIALFFALFRLWFVLIITYISILLDVILAPFWIAASLLPGSPIGFGMWLRSLISNLAAFPAVIIMFLLARAFGETFGNCAPPGCNPNQTFVPPLIGGAPGTELLGALIELGILLMTPGIVGMVKQALRAPAPSGAPIMTALGVATATPSGLLATGSQIGGTLFGLSHLSMISRVIPGLGRIRQQGPGPQQPTP